MDRELLVTLIRKNIDELIMLTEGFMEMTTYPAAIINLAKNKTDDIWSYINQLENLNPSQQTIPATNDDPEFNTSMPDEDNLLDERTEESTMFKTEEEEEPKEADVLIANKEKNSLEERIEEATEIREKTTELQEDADIIREHITENQEKTDKDEKDTEEIREDTEEIREDAEEIRVKTAGAESFEEIRTNREPENVREFTVRDSVEKKITLAEKIANAGASRNDMLAQGEHGDINATIGNKKVEDIRQAISLGDRFRFQRELFKNNGEEMNKTLSYINKLATYDEVVDFLQSKYKWEEDNATAEDFYQIIKRKF